MVDDDVGVGQLVGGVDAAPADSDRAQAGRAGRLHVERRVADVGRFVGTRSEPLEGKGRQRYIGCGPEGRMGLAMQEKHRTEKNERFFKLHRGDIISVTKTEVKGDGLGLDDTSEVKVVAYAGQGVPPAPKTPRPPGEGKGEGA